MVYSLPMIVRYCGGGWWHIVIVTGESAIAGSRRRTLVGSLAYHILLRLRFLFESLEVPFNCFYQISGP